MHTYSVCMCMHTLYAPLNVIMGRGSQYKEMGRGGRWCGVCVCVCVCVQGWVCYEGWIGSMEVAIDLYKASLGCQVWFWTLVCVHVHVGIPAVWPMLTTCTVHYI